ncbi:MbnP family protein [Vaginella massiliensis]|uniref:MbnP family protein n=1 Tax=Vaginella massiliensis TaxID=1816680 RepID=UPI003753BA6A
MYKYSKLALSIGLSLLFLSFFTACKSDDDFAKIDESKDGELELKFENGFEGVGGIVLGATTQQSALGQYHNFSTLKYIISNIELIDENGQVFSYHYNNPDQGAFVINQENARANIVYVQLKDIPQRKYTKLRFGLGIHQSAYLLGHDGQAKFWNEAKQQGMTWSWASGYVFVKLEGKYGQEFPTKPYKNHTGNMGNVTANQTADLYRVIELNLPTNARVSTKVKPSIHIMANLNNFLSGDKKLLLDDTNDDTMGSSPFMVEVTNNLSGMFRVDHVHNDEAPKNN